MPQMTEVPQNADLVDFIVQKSKAYARKDETWVSTDQSFLRMAKFN
jgi:hypothetical protein